MRRNRRLASICAASVLLTLLACSKTKEEKPVIPRELASLSADALNEKGMQFHRQRQFAESARHFEYATIQDPAYFKGYFNMACAYSLLRNEERALAALRQAAAINPGWVRANQADGDLDWLRTRSGFAAAVSAEPSSVPASGDGTLVGREICRKAVGPDDTLWFEVKLQDGGVVSGAGSWSGATGALDYESGSWREERGFVLLKLQFSGLRVDTSTYHPDGYRQVQQTETVEKRVSAAALSNHPGCTNIQ